jgi:ankyrin repeat protein
MVTLLLEHGFDANDRDMYQLTPLHCAAQEGGLDVMRVVTVSPSPQSKDEENEKLHKLREYARDFRRQHTTDAEQFDWDSDDGDYGLAIGRLVVT